MGLQVVWQILDNGKWASTQELREASGVDEDIINPIINFLYRWSFVDIQRSPELHVRRKSGAISPVEIFDSLWGIAVHRGSSVSKTRTKLAERVACRVCNGRQLSFVGVNEVECAQCHERQWYAIETGELLNNLKR